MAKMALIFCAVFFVVGYLCEPQKINPVTIFFGEWTVILFLANLNLYSIIPASNYIYGYILVGCICFAIGFYLVRIQPFRIVFYTNGKKLGNTFSGDLNKKVVYPIIVVTIIFLLIDSAQSIVSLVQGNSLEVIRKYSQEGMQYGSNRFINAIRILVTTPMSYIVMPLATVEFFKYEKNRFIIFSAVIISILRVIGDGGRSPLIFFGLCFILCYFYQSKGRIKRKKLKKAKNKLVIKKKSIIFLCVLLLGIVLLYQITLSRSGANTIRYTYYYFAMEPIMFEKWALRTDQAGLMGFGRASFNGFLFPLFYLISSIFQIGYPKGWRQIYDIIELVGTDWQVITSTGLSANSYASVFWNLYLDGRILGIIVGMFIYGIFVANIYQKVINFKNEKNLSIFCLTMLGLFYSFQFIIFENIYYSLAFLALEFLVFKNGNRNKSNVVRRVN